MISRASQLFRSTIVRAQQHVKIPLTTFNRGIFMTNINLETSDSKVDNPLIDLPIFKEEFDLVKGKKKNQRVEQDDSSYSHVLNVHCSLNNTILTLCNSSDQVIATASSGTAGFKKAQRAGFEAAYQAAIQLVEKTKLKRQNVRELLVKFKGFGPGREAVFRSIRSNTNWTISRITDTTPIPHNGCRPPKPRRL